MAVPTGTSSTYDLTVGVKLDFEDAIYLLDPFDVPLLGTYGSDGRSVISKDTCFEKKVEWQDETLLTPRTTATAASTTAEATVTVAAAERKRFQTGDLILVNKEVVRVTGYNATSTKLDVTRNVAGTSAQIATDDVLVGVGTALPEGSDPEAPKVVDRTNRHNLTEIFGPYAVKISESENAVRKYGIAGREFDHQVMQRTREAAVAQEQALVYGQRFDDTTNEWRAMGGMDFYITVNVDSTTTSLTTAKLLDQLQNIYDAGGMATQCLVGSSQKRNISNFNSSDVRLNRMDNGRGQTVDYFDSDFGRVDMVLDRWVRKTDLFLYNRDQATLCTLRPLAFTPLAKTGDAEQGQIVCEKTLRFRADKHAAKFNALT